MKEESISSGTLDVIDSYIYVNLIRFLSNSDIDNMIYFTKTVAMLIKWREEFEDTKGVIRIRISKKDIQHNGQKKIEQKNKQQSKYVSVWQGFHVSIDNPRRTNILFWFNIVFVFIFKLSSW